MVEIPHFCCEFLMSQVCFILAARSGNGSQPSSSASSGSPLLTAQDERLGFEAAVAALGLNLSEIALCCL